MQEISKRHERKIAVLPLISRNQENASIGIWLAKQIAANLESRVPQLELVDASSVVIPVLAPRDSPHPSYDQKAVAAFANIPVLESWCKAASVHSRMASVCQ